MKLFLDTAHVETIEKWAATGILDGVTTNPSSLSKEGGDPKKNVLAICKLLPHGDISVEVTQQDPKQVYEQALQISKLAENVFVKIPCHIDYYPLIKKLAAQGVKLNITLVFTMLQALMMCKLNVHYISPFVGRLEDIDGDGSELIPDIKDMIDLHGFNTKILAASIRTVQQFHDAVIHGADAVTLSADVLEKSVTHVLTDQGMAKFSADWKKLGISQFP